MDLQNRTTDALQQLLSTGDEADRCYAARTLGVLRAEDAIDDLAQCLRDEDIDVCVDAAEALGRIGSADALPHLLVSLENETDGEVGKAVVAALGNLGGEQAIGLLKKVARQRPENLEWVDEWDNWWDMQLAAVEALGRFGDDEAADLLLEVLEEDEAADIEEAIYRALAGLGDKGRDALIARLDAGPARSRRRAAKALGAVDSTEAVRALGRALRDDGADVRAGAIESLQQQGAHRYLGAVLLLLRDEAAEVRSAAAKAAAGLAKAGAGDDDLMAQMSPLLSDPSPQVRAVTMDTIRQAGVAADIADEALDAVRENLRHAEPSVAESAVHLFGDAVEAADAEPVLLELLADAELDGVVRRRAALSLGSLPTVNAGTVVALRDAVVDASQIVRLSALTALMDLQSAEIREEEETDEPPVSPLQVVMEAVRGEIEIPVETPEDVIAEQPTIETAESEPAEPESAEPQVLDGQPVSFEPDALKRMASANDSEPGEAPEAAAKPIERPLPLPDSTPPELEGADRKPAMSTLDAITQDNAEVALMYDEVLSGEEVPGEPVDPELVPFFELIEAREERSERMFPKRTFDVAKDVRYLGARILCRSSDEQAVETLIQALSDDSVEMRGEAANALAEVAARDPRTAGLMNAFGSLVTLLGVEQREQKIACIRALASLRNRAAIGPLLDAMGDTLPDVRIHVVRALAELAVNGMDPEKDDHMVTRDFAPRTMARKLAAGLEDTANGVRCETARAMARLLKLDGTENLLDSTMDAIVTAAFEDAGQQARTMGQALRAIDPQKAEEKLLARLDAADGSMERRFVIEMLEEVFKPAANA